MCESVCVYVCVTDQCSWQVKLEQQQQQQEEEESASMLAVSLGAEGSVEQLPPLQAACPAGSRRLG